MATRAATILFFLMAAFAQAQTYTFFTFDPPGSTATTVTGINNAGQIVGYFNDATGTHGFLRTGAIYITIVEPDALPNRTFPTAIDNKGEIAGWFTGANGPHGFVRSADGRSFTVFDAPDLGVGMTTPSGIDDSGAIVGNGFSGALVDTGFLRSPQGSYTTIEVPGASNTFARGIDNKGEIAGYFRIGGSGGYFQGFVRSPEGTYQAVNVPGVQGTQVTGINNMGQLGGSFSNSLFVRNADGTFVTFSAPDILATPAGINDSGTVAGSFGAGNARHGFLAVPSQGPTRPAIRTEHGVISASAFGGFDATAPASWIEIYGQNLAGTTREWRTSDFNGNAAPTSLDGVSVRIDGQPAFVSYISPGQINAQVPSTIAPGTAQVVVFRDGQSSAAYAIPVNAMQPGLLMETENVLTARFATALFPDNVTYALPPNVGSALPSRLAKAGDTLTLYGIGFGPVTPDTPAGRIATGASSLPSSLRISFNGVPVTVAYAGLSPGSVGLYQFNVIVPPGAGRPGNQSPVQVSLNDILSRQQAAVAIEP